MKKAYVLILFLALTTGANAQLIHSIGIKLGGTASYMKWDYSARSVINNFDTDTKNGFNIGVFAEVLHAPVFSMVAEVNYIEKGAQKEIPVTTLEHPDGTGETTTWKLNLNYMNFNLLGKVRLDGLIFTPYIIAGPKIDVRVNTFTGSDDFDKIRLGFKAGMGTDVKLFGINFLAEVLWDTDFGSLHKNDYVKITSSSIDFRGGFFINL